MSTTLEAQIDSLQNATLRERLNDDLKRTYLDIVRNNTENLLPFRPVKSSPTPWELVDNDWEIWDADGSSIACVGHDSSTEWGKMLDAVNGQLIVRAVNAHQELVAALRELVTRCDGEEGVRADGSNIQTMRAHAVLAELEGA